jgi:hypothetical protein
MKKEMVDFMPIVSITPATKRIYRQHAKESKVSI